MYKENNKKGRELLVTMEREITILNFAFRPLSDESEEEADIDKGDEEDDDIDAGKEGAADDEDDDNAGLE
jgi:hypothetical protein